MRKPKGDPPTPGTDREELPDLPAWAYPRGPKEPEPNQWPESENDAWCKEMMLHRENTRTWEVRADLRVDALGCDRAVRLTLVKRDLTDPLSGTRWYDTNPRNVGTMRELAQALLDACDFVDSVNPKWAEGHDRDEIDILVDADPLALAEQCRRFRTALEAIRQAVVPTDADVHSDLEIYQELARICKQLARDALEVGNRG